LEQDELAEAEAFDQVGGLDASNAGLELRIQVLAFGWCIFRFQECAVEIIDR